MPAPEGNVRRLTTLFLSLSILLAGCAAHASPISPHDPHVLRWGIVGLNDVPTLDPALAADATSLSVTSLVFGGLVRLDSHLQVQSDGASHWTISPDGTVYTFYLRPNLRFADGTPVTAADFAFSLERALGPQRSVGTGEFYLGLIKGSTAPSVRNGRGIAGISVVDSRTLRLKLTHPAAHFLTELAFPASFVLEEKQLRQLGQTWTDHAAGFGPYQVSVWRHSNYLTLERNPYYYGGRPAIARINMYFYQDQKSALQAYRNGDLDLVSGWQAGDVSPAQLPGLRHIPGLAQDYLAFNTAQPPLNVLKNRR